MCALICALIGPWCIDSVDEQVKSCSVPHCGQDSARVMTFEDEEAGEDSFEMQGSQPFTMTSVSMRVCVCVCVCARARACVAHMDSGKLGAARTSSLDIHHTHTHTHTYTQTHTHTHNLSHTHTYTGGMRGMGSCPGSHETRFVVATQSIGIIHGGG